MAQEPSQKEGSWLDRKKAQAKRGLDTAKHKLGLDVNHAVALTAPPKKGEPTRYIRVFEMGAGNDESVCADQVFEDLTAGGARAVRGTLLKGPKGSAGLFLPIGEQDASKATPIDPSAVLEGECKALRLEAPPL